MSGSAANQPQGPARPPLGEPRGELPSFEQLRELAKGKIIGWNETRDFLQLMFPDFERIRDRQFEEFVLDPENGLTEEHLKLVEAAQEIVDRQEREKAAQAASDNSPTKK